MHGKIHPTETAASPCRRLAAGRLGVLAFAAMVWLGMSPVHGQNVEFRQLSIPAGVVNQTTFPVQGSQVSTVTAAVTVSGYHFTHWTLNTVRVNDPSGHAANPVTFTISEPSEAVANYLLEAQDSDNDTLPDWWEIYYFGNLTQTAGGDPDGDGFTNAAELALGSHPGLHDDRMQGGVSRRRAEVTTLTIADPGLLDTDRDGFIRSFEDFRGYLDTAYDRLDQGGASRRRSQTVFVVQNPSFVRIEEASTPAGVLSRERIVAAGSVVDLYDAPLTSNGWRFTGWLVNGLRVDTVPKNQPIPITVTANTLAVARYVSETADTDSDGIADWMEWYYFNSLEHNLDSDPDGDTLTWRDELFRGYSTVAPDSLAQGGISRRRSATLEVDTTGRILYRMVSTPTGMVNQSGLVPPGTVVTSTDLATSASGNFKFAYWDVNGIRQTDPGGYSRSLISFPVNAPVVATAHYVNNTIDDDFDKILDWFELVNFGTINRSGSNDGDNDGLSLSGEIFRGYSPTARDNLAAGGVSRRRSTLIGVNTVQLTVAPIVTVNGPTDVTPTSARLNALINRSGLETTVYFEHGPTAAYGTTTTVQNIGSGNVPVTVAEPVTGLLPATVYHFRVVAENSRGITRSADYTFSTLWDAVAGEGFEGSDITGRWQITGGVWQAGAPATGQPFAGAAVAGTNLSGGYAPNADSRLVSPLFEVPAIGLTPQLRFHEWWQFGTGDYGAVEVREGTTGPWQTLATFTDQHTQWMEKSLDLSSFAGRRIQVAFHLLANADASAGPGWYLDQVSLVTGELSQWQAVAADTFLASNFWTDWTVTGTVWQAGEPTSGPGVAFEGLTCAGTRLDGNYPDNADSRLVSGFFQVPSADQSPRFRFWQWFQFGGGDRGSIDVRELGGTWQELDSLTGSSGGSWSKPAVALSSFAGKWIQVAFHLRSDGAGNAPGWYVDNAKLVTGVEVVNNPETFDGDIGEWYGDLAGLWQVGRPTSGPGSAKSGQNLAATNLGGNYSPDSIARLESPAFDVGDPGFGRLVTLRFWDWHQYGTGDQGEVQISVSDGNTWSEWVTLLSVTGSSADWQQESMDLTSYKGRKVRLGFLHTANSDSSTGAGWYVDDVEITSLVLAEFNPSTPVTNTLTASGTRQFYVLNVTTPGPLSLDLDLLGTGASTAVYVRRAGYPTFGDYDYRAAVSGTADQHLLIPLASTGTYYVMVYAPSVSATSEYRLSATLQSLVLETVSPTLVDTRLASVLNLSGAGFQPGMNIELIGASTFAATSIEVTSLASVRASFAAGSIAAGRYAVRVSVAGQPPVVLPDAVEFRSAGEGRLEANLVTPGSLGRSTPATFYVEYRNVGDAPISAPMLSLFGSGQSLLTLDPRTLATGLWAGSTPSGFSNSASFFAGNNGTLNPGESVTVPVYYAGLRSSETSVDLQVGALLPGNTTPVDWAGLKSTLRPAGIPAEAWDILFANLTSMAGSTWGNYADMLAQTRSYLAGLRPEGSAPPVSDASDLLVHRLMIANGLSPMRSLAGGTDAAMPAPGISLAFSRSFPEGIIERFAIGPLGRGWYHSWEVHAEAATDGAVELVGPGPSRRRFEPDSRRPGQFINAQATDHGTLRLVSGNYRLTELDGSLTVFRSDLKLGYVEDSNANRITALYTGGNLTSLTHSNGDSLTLDYNAAGRIASITDSVGRVTTYGYDASGEHLTSVTAKGRVTQYGYDTAAGSAARHAITSIASPDTTVRNLGYDTRGWLASISKNAGLEGVSFGYDRKGTVTATDALAKTTTFYFNERGLLAKTRNPLGYSVQMAYDADFNLTAITDPAGRSQTYTYDGKGNVLRTVDALGAVTQFSYTSTLNKLAAVVDANGNPTRYNYDGKGNPTAITYADNSHEDWSYDDTGKPLTWTNRRSHSINYEHDAAGRPTKKTYADGSVVTLAYDARGNLSTTVDAHGTTSFDYDANDQLTSITYPGSRWLHFTYDSAGRRASSLDQFGHRLDYFYDTFGKLSHIIDETGVEIVRYVQDAAGRTMRKDLGNGVFTTYDYDDAGQLLHLVNFKPDGSILSRFDYTYDSRSRRTAMATLDGTWTYGYDDIGQLTRAVFASTNGTVPSQDLTYLYDKLGNRIRTVENGVTKEYTTNHLNQYTTVGDTTYVFDADGNLTEERAPSGTTVYAYNSENRLVGMTSSSGASSFVYDALGNRVSTTENGVLSHHVIDPAGFGNVVGDYSAGGAKVGSYDHTLELIRSTVSGAASAYHLFDGSGNASQTTSGAGDVVNSYHFAPFGASFAAAGTAPNRAGFAGQFGASKLNANLTTMRARVYSASLGRFLSQDPLNIFGGDLNLMTYVRNSPMGNIDPNGTFLLPLAGAGAAIGAVTNGAFYAIGAFTAPSGGEFSWRGLAGAVVSGALQGFVTGATGGAIVPGIIAGGVFNGVGYAIENWGTNEFSLAGLLQSAGVGAATGWIPTKMLGFTGRWWGTGRPGWVAAFLKNHGQALWASLSASNALQNLVGRLVAIFVPRDPNDCIGPSGYGSPNFVAFNQVLPYRVRFENDKDAAAPAQAVVITDNLSSQLDWATFQVTEIGFGDQIVSVPAGSANFETQHACTVDGHDIVADIFAGIDAQTGQAFCRIYTLDPTTGLPPAVDVGLLPPEDGTGRGKGWFSYTIRPKATTPTGTSIRNVALIKFDANEVIATNQIDPHDASKGTDPTKEALVTVDANVPTSFINHIPAQMATTFPLSWTGNAGIGGSGIAGYTVYVSDNGGTSYAPWLTDTTATTATFTGTAGSTYRFYVEAKSNVGLRQGGDPALNAVSTTTLDAGSLILQRPGNPLVVTGSSIDFGSVPMGKSAAIVFTLKNTGTKEISGIAITKDGTNTADYTVTGPKVTKLAAKGSTTFTVTFKPTVTGARAAAFHIANRQTGAALAFAPIHIYMTGAGGLAPVILTQPQPVMAALGTSAEFSVALDSTVPMAAPISYQWQRNGANITGATGATYTIPKAALNHAGTYKCVVKNSAGIVTSDTAELGVVDTGSVNKVVAATSTLKLTLNTAGNGQNFAWERVAGTLPATATGGTTKTLTVKALATTDTGTYRCVVSGPGGPVTGGTTTLSVFDDAPVITTPVVMPDAYVSGSYSFPIPINTASHLTPTKFTATGLPRGLSCNAATGIISGKPTAFKTAAYDVVLKASNSKGDSTADTTLFVHPLSTNAIGTFNALVERDTTLSAPIATPPGQKLQGHGGSLENLVVTSTGSFTATLKLEDKSYAMPKGSVLDAHTTGNPTARVVIKRGLGIADLTMNLTFHIDTNELTGTLTDGLVATPVKIQGWRNPWVVSKTAALNHPATELAGTYTAMMDFADGDLDSNPAYPQGQGYGTLTVTEAGIATWSGMLADGTAITRSSTLGPNGEVPLHWLLYTPKDVAAAGSAHGWVQVKAGANAALPDDNLLDTMLDLNQAVAKDQPMFDWMKMPQSATSKTLSYKDGFSLHKLTVTGGGYVKPAASVRVLGLTNANDQGKLTFSSANLEPSVTYLNAAPGSGPTASMSGKLFTITSANKAIFPTLPSAAMANPAALTLKIDAGTGMFNGTFTLQGDPDPTDHVGAIAPLTRKGVKFSGVLVQRLGKGFGCFQLPQLPADGPPKTTLSTSPQLSGQVLLEAGP